MLLDLVYQSLDQHVNTQINLLFDAQCMTRDLGLG